MVKEFKRKEKQALKIINKYKNKIFMIHVNPKSKLIPIFHTEVLYPHKIKLYLDKGMPEDIWCITYREWEKDCQFVYNNKLIDYLELQKKTGWRSYA